MHMHSFTVGLNFKFLFSGTFGGLAEFRQKPFLIQTEVDTQLLVQGVFFEKVTDNFGVAFTPRGFIGTGEAQRGLTDLEVSLQPQPTLPNPNLRVRQISPGNENDENSMKGA